MVPMAVLQIAIIKLGFNFELGRGYILFDLTRSIFWSKLLLRFNCRRLGGSTSIVCFSPLSRWHFLCGLLKLTFKNEDNAKTGDVFIPWLARACCKSLAMNVAQTQRA